LRDGFGGIARCNGCDLTRRELTIARERSGRGDDGVDLDRKGRALAGAGRVC